MHLTRAALLAALLATGCKTKNPNYCPDNPDMLCDQVDAAMGCEMADDCTGPDSVCKLPDGICVECTAEDDAACTGTRPVCNDATNRCEACDAHSDCASDACLPTGACAAEADVAYVAPGGTSASCMKTTPCGTLEEALARGTPLIKVAGGGMAVTDDRATVIDGQTVTILADADAKLTRSGTGPLLEIKGSTTNVSIFDLELTGATGSGTAEDGTGLYISGGTPTVTLDRVLVHGNRAVGIYAKAGKLTIRSSALVGNIAGGADLFDAQLTLVNNLIVANGSGTSLTGGLTLRPATGSVIEHNTIADNSSSASTVATRGVNCIIAFPATSNIVTGNDLGASCTFDYTLVDLGKPVTGNNRAGVPMFKTTDTTNPRAQALYRIATGSSAIDLASPASTVATDIDGDPRPATGKDSGADELMP